LGVYFILTSAAINEVVAKTTTNLIIPDTAAEVVVTILTEEMIDAIATLDHIVAVATVERKRVSPAAAERRQHIDGVVASIAVERAGPVQIKQGIVAIAAAERVVAVSACQMVITATAVESVVTRIAAGAFIRAIASERISASRRTSARRPNTHSVTPISLRVCAAEFAMVVEHRDNVAGRSVLEVRNANFVHSQTRS